MIQTKVGNYIYAEHGRKKVQLVTELVNDHMQKVAAGVEIERKIRTNDARHSYATIMKIAVLL